jgi:hypothetical protein
MDISAFLAAYRFFWKLAIGNKKVKTEQRALLNHFFRVFFPLRFRLFHLRGFGFFRRTFKIQREHFSKM